MRQSLSVFPQVSHRTPQTYFETFILPTIQLHSWKMTSIPIHQQAAVVEDPGDNFKILLRNDIPVGEPGPEEILVKLTCTGLW